MRRDRHKPHVAVRGRTERLGYRQPHVAVQQGWPRVQAWEEATPALVVKTGSAWRAGGSSQRSNRENLQADRVVAVLWGPGQCH